MNGTPETSNERTLKLALEVFTELAKTLKQERDEAREALSDWENAALHVEADHPDEKHCGCVPVLRKLLTDAREAFVIATDQMVIAQGKLREANKERDEAREALMKIEDLFIDGTDIYADRENMGIIARNALEGAK
jgi:hypothetical protein